MVFEHLTLKLGVMGLTPLRNYYISVEPLFGVMRISTGSYTEPYREIHLGVWDSDLALNAENPTYTELYIAFCKGLEGLPEL